MICQQEASAILALENVVILDLSLLWAVVTCVMGSEAQHLAPCGSPRQGFLRTQSLRGCGQAERQTRCQA